MMQYPEHNLAHLPGPDVPDDLPPVRREDLHCDELDERVSNAVYWLRVAKDLLPDHAGIRHAVHAFTEEGW